MAGFSVPSFTWFYQGAIAAGGSVNVYQTGTTTPITIYSDGALMMPITNPITLDANGQCKFYVSGSVNIRMDGYTAAGAFIETIDPIYPVSGTTSSAGQVVYEASNFTLSTTNNGNNIVATAAINIALPVTTGFSNSFSAQINAQGGAVTLIPNASDSIQKQTAGTNYILPQGSSGELWTDGAGNWGINFLSSSISPTNQVFTSGSGTYTTPTSFGTVKYLRIRMVAGGGGGGGTAGTGTAGNGTGTSFGSFTTISGSGGANGTGTSNTTVNGGIGGTGGSGTALNRIPGKSGAAGPAYNASYYVLIGGAGGDSAMGFGGIGGAVANGQAGQGPGAGGGGGGYGSTVSGGGGGGAGEYAEIIITNPGATYSYTVGAGGTGGTGTDQAGGAGYAGKIIVEEFYH